MSNKILVAVAAFVFETLKYTGKCESFKSFRYSLNNTMNSFASRTVYFGQYSRTSMAQTHSEPWKYVPRQEIVRASEF